uniref:Leucine-rich repeat-containing N-terminal plant-type domain-containing protein n=1 Tax=Triticum urartu TaxID=4572 RepID=A0A8R7TNE2_TRIUA
EARHGAGRGRLVAVAALLLPVVVLLSWCRGVAAQPTPPCGDGDLAALRGFSAGLDAPVDGWPAVADDDEDGCCAWPGVVCGRPGVVGVVLPNQTLRGEVAASLAGLTALRMLNLSGNALRGALPPGLLRLRRLEVLDVSSNALAGAIGPELELPAARVFNVSYNAFNGSHPVLPGAVNLMAYDASGNGFEGPVD